MSDRDQNESHEESPQQQKLNKYIRELLAEKALVDEAKCPHLYKLVDEELQKVQASGKVPFRDQKFVDVYRERPVKVNAKVMVPVKEHPRYNFLGKILGPKGNTLKQLQEETMCHISICGRGSIRDRQKEEDLRNSLEPKYAHLQDDLHIDISTLGPPAEAHARIAFALAEIRKYLIPEYGDTGRPEPLMDFMSKPPGLHDDRSMQRKPPGMFRGAGRRPTSGPASSSRGGPVRPPYSRRPQPSILDRSRGVDDYEGGYGVQETEYDDYRGEHSSNIKPSYPCSYGNDYEDDYYRDDEGGAGGSYGMSGPDFGYKKRKTYMD